MNNNYNNEDNYSNNNQMNNYSNGQNYNNPMNNYSNGQNYNNPMNNYPNSQNYNNQMNNYPNGQNYSNQMNNYPNGQNYNNQGIQYNNNKTMDKLQNTQILAIIGVVVLLLGLFFDYIGLYSIMDTNIGFLVLICCLANALIIFRDVAVKNFSNLFNNNFGRTLMNLNAPKVSLGITALTALLVLYVHLRSKVGLNFNYLELGFYMVWGGIICIFIYTFLYKPNSSMLNQMNTYNNGFNNIMQNNTNNNPSFTQNQNNNMNYSQSTNQNNNMNYSQSINQNNNSTTSNELLYKSTDEMNHSMDINNDSEKKLGHAFNLASNEKEKNERDNNYISKDNENH